MLTPDTNKRAIILTTKIIPVPKSGSNIIRPKKRNKTDDIILPFKLGTVAIAKRSKTNIVPFAISGKYRLIRNNLTLTIGKEIETDKYSSSELLEKLETDVKELILKK